MTRFAKDGIITGAAFSAGFLIESLPAFSHPRSRGRALYEAKLTRIVDIVQLPKIPRRLVSNENPL